MPIDDEGHTVDEWAPYYDANCPCDTCDGLRDELEIEEGHEFDLDDEFDLSTTVPPNNEDGDLGNCDVCHMQEAEYELRERGTACQDCFDMAPIIYCKECGGFSHVDLDADWGWYNDESSGESSYCLECVNYSLGTKTCDNCEGRKILKDGAEFYDTRGGREICTDCATSPEFIDCIECGDYIAQAQFNGARDPRHGIICENCIEEGFEVCNICGVLHDVGGGFRDCDCPDTGIHRYSFTPANLTFFTGKHELEHGDYVTKNNGILRPYFGIEIEVESPMNLQREEGALRARECELFYCKRDASLDDGFEVVSHPFTWDWLKENYHRKVAPVFEDLREIGFESFHTPTCGMHVHISKDAWTKMMLYKTMKLIYENSRFTLTLSEREQPELDRWCSISRESDDALIQKSMNPTRNVFDEPHPEDTTGHACAVNVNKASTVEFRIFKGTIDEDKFFKNMEFCMAVREFSRTTPISYIRVPEFLDFVDKYSNRYKHLNAFLKRNFL